MTANITDCLAPDMLHSLRLDLPDLLRLLDRLYHSHRRHHRVQHRQRRQRHSYDDSSSDNDRNNHLATFKRVVFISFVGV